MDLITTHVNADFDALGSLVAAKKLYPDSRLLLPGSQERAVREFLALTKDMMTFETEKWCRLDDVDRLVLVDTRHKSRIGIAAELLARGVDVHIYDHHPRMKGDITADKDVYEEVGATVTILADIIRRKRTRLSCLEATIMLLGIYEETGSLTYRTTTRLDVDMVSYLLSKGANLEVVSSYLNRELSEEEVSFLTKLIGSTKKVLVNGLNVSMAEMDSKDYVGEIGMLVHKLMELENIPVLFLFITAPREKINIIARSALKTVDVNKILSHFGGGGHSTAASARVEGASLERLKERLMKILRSSVKVRLYAEDIMSRDVKTVSLNKTIDETKALLLKRKILAMPVMENNRLAGIITLKDLEKAIRHGFGHSRIKGYMSNVPAAIRPKTPLYLIHKLMLKKDATVLPVIKGRKIVGIIDTGIVLKNVHEGLFSKPGTVRRKVLLNLSKRMSSCFSKDIINLLKKIGRLSNSLGYSAFVVGGLVRDLVLGVKNLDLDIVIEGDAIEVARALSKDLKAALIVHKRFGTASVVTKARLKIDLATARKEIYEKPAALPTVVEFSSLKNDLIRRDFTINAMALGLNKTNFGQLIDFFGGEADLERGRIRVMHDGSFMDDPTRIFRAVRFEQRFNFAIDGHTEDLIKNAVRQEMFEKVEPQRIRDEVILILKEKEPLKALDRMDELHELRFIHPKIGLDRRLAEFYNSIDETCLWYESSDFKKRPIERWLIYLMALLENLSYDETSNLCDRFVFKRGERLRILSYKRDASRILKVLSEPSSLSPHRIYKILEPLSYEVILLMAAKATSRLAGSRIKDFFMKYNGARIKTRGSDLRSLGLKPGPEFKKILKKTLYKKIDGYLRTKRDELEYAKTLIGRR